MLQQHHIILWCKGMESTVGHWGDLGGYRGISSGKGEEGGEKSDYGGSGLPGLIND